MTFVNEMREKKYKCNFLIFKQEMKQAGLELAEADLQVSRKKLPKNFMDLNQRGQAEDRLRCQRGKPDCSTRC